MTTDQTAAVFAALEGLQGTAHHLPPGTRQAVAEHLARVLPAVPSAAAPPTQADGPCSDPIECEHEAALGQAREQYMAGLRRADEMNNALMEEVQRYADGTERPVLWSVYNEMHKRALTAEARAAAMERGMESTAADALAHGGCHRKLMAQCLRAERAEAVVERVRTVLETEVVVGRSALEYRGLIVSALMADEAPQPGKQGDRIVAYVLTARTELHCLRCAPSPAGDIWTSVTTEELEDGGICTVCGADVLIEVKPS